VKGGGSVVESDLSDLSIRICRNKLVNVNYLGSE